MFPDRYPLDVARRRMQLGAVLPDSEKCVYVSVSPLPLQQHIVNHSLC